MTEVTLAVLDQSRNAVLDGEVAVTVRGRLSVAKQPEPWVDAENLALPTHTLVVSDEDTAVQPLRHLRDDDGRIYFVQAETEQSAALAYGTKRFRLQLQPNDGVSDA